jgi:hypothetical protein
MCNREREVFCGSWLREGKSDFGADACQRQCRIRWHSLSTVTGVTTALTQI